MQVVFIIVFFIVSLAFIGGATIVFATEKWGMKRGLNLSGLGSLQHSYGTISGAINGVWFNRFLVLDRYEHGLILRTWKILGQYLIIIRHEDIDNVTKKQGTLGRRVILSMKNGDKYVIYGKFVDDMTMY